VRRPIRRAAARSLKPAALSIGSVRVATLSRALWISLLSASTGAIAQTTEPLPTLEHCAAIGAPADRLACYDKLAGRAPAPAEPTAQQAPPNAAPPSTSALAPSGAPLADTAAPPAPSSLLSKYWELDAADKRGIFNFVGYKPNYVLPMHVTSRINRAPQSPTQAAVSQPDYRREEAKFQLSLRTKLAQDLLLPGADLWVGFTQLTLWQIFNGTDSKPFRNTDYEPDVMAILPTPKGWRELPLGWQWRYTQFGLAHQSNGQSDPLSRSWNRVYVAGGFERGDWSLTARFNQRLNEDPETDNNPDLVTYRGRGEFQLTWAQGLQTASLLYRTTLTGVRYGALQFEWSYPVSSDQPNGLRWFVQAFRGYGETLTDYNFRQTSFGVGVTFLQF
jgi:phospholipase A1/A2